jgi:hypothetical protein
MLGFGDKKDPEIVLPYKAPIVDDSSSLSRPVSKTADAVMAEIAPPKATQESQKQTNAANSPSGTGATARILRGLSLNKDISWMILFGVACLAVGWCAKGFAAGLSVKEISQSITDLLAILFAVAGAVTAGVVRTALPAGSLAKALIWKVSKKETEVNEWGVTIQKQSPIVRR